MSYKDFESWQFVEDQYFVGWVLNPDDHSKKFWESFLQENPEKIQDIMMAKEVVRGLQYEESSELEGESYVHLFERILETKRRREIRAQQTIRPMLTSSMLKYAAMLAVALGTLFLWVTNQRNQPTRVSYKTVESPAGSHMTTLLSDGTKVKLNSGSKIRFRAAFEDQGARIVYLEGEAFFDVSKDPDRPFQVVSEYVVTEVLGTSFNVMAYPEDDVVAVAVAEGKVKVSATDKIEEPFLHELLPMQESRVNLVSHQSEKRNLTNEGSFAWVDWKLICEDEPLESILKKVERWYGVHMQIAEGVNLQEKYTGVFNNDPLKVILDAFQSQGAFDYKREGEKEIKIWKQ